MDLAGRYHCDVGVGVAHHLRPAISGGPLLTDQHARIRRFPGLAEYPLANEVRSAYHCIATCYGMIAFSRRNR